VVASRHASGAAPAADASRHGSAPPGGCVVWRPPFGRRTPHPGRSPGRVSPRVRL